MSPAAEARAELVRLLAETGEDLASARSRAEELEAFREHLSRSAAALEGAD